ncbi:hypothetical protein [Streptomyces candidus]|uniref:Uncharacterized protein n=1 Tax=Streptomyces candidus TaxID=67283 RepID=A0A7X0HKU9_9ACTN|nr:hypothetical protein [Streptomyces candidus]MBB6439547.1 hypothetical protein [Streptomyces candidus]GHH54520.1 hypothetical protein GCM10018773_57600 [Streptomyces candidus]
MTDSSHRLLLPDDEDWLGLLMGMEEPLLLQLSLNTRDARAGDEDVWEVPADLDTVAAHDAWGRIIQALPEPLREGARNSGRYVPAETRPAGQYTLYAPDGRYEHTPLYPVNIDQNDVAALVALLGHLRRALEGKGGSQLGEFLESLAGDWAEPGREPDAKRLVGDFARALAVLQLERQPDVELLLNALAAVGPDERATDPIVLSPPQEDAYQRYMTRVSSAVAGGDRHEYALHRFAND